MAGENTNLVTTDIYKITNFIDSIKAKYIDIPEDTLMLGVYGYLSSIFSNLMENTAIMSSEYSNEAIPTKAKYEKNLIAHALAMNINTANARGAEMEVLLGLPEEALVQNMVNDKFTLDKEFIFYLGDREQYPFILDYDIIISRDILPNGNFVYNARYDITGTNKLANLQNPYLPALGTITVSGDNLIALQTTIRQVTHTQIFKKIITNNPLENKMISFSFEDQLAYFYVEVVENGVTHYLEPVYDGLYDYRTDDQKEYINYIYLDESNIRLIFNRDSYQPRENAEVTIHVYTTLGSEANFSVEKYERLMPLSSDRFPYSGLYILLQSMTDSQYGSDKATVEQLKAMIPKEALSRGSITTYTDLNAFFNNLQTEDCRLYFLERVHNQVERLFFCYLLMKDGSNVIPTNTITASITRGMFSNISANNLSMKPGSKFYEEYSTDPDVETSPKGITTSDKSELERLDKTGFLYMNPFLTIVNKSPFYVSYYNVYMNYTRSLYFEYINDKSLLQFVALNFYCHRDYFTDPDTYKIELSCTQNINTDFQLLKYDEEGTLQECNVKIIAVLYNSEDVAYRYLDSELVDFDEPNATFSFVFKFKTNDIISKIGTYMTIVSGMKNTSSGQDSTSSQVSPTMGIKFFFLAKLDQEYGRLYGDNLQYSLDDTIPNLTGWTLTNVYNAGELGLDIFYDYSDLQNSYITLSKLDDGSFDYTIYKMPVVKYSYINTEERLRNLLSIVDRRRRYIQDAIFLLEDSFGIDYKFFNTYGKSLMYNIENETNIDKINLSLKFEIKFQMEEDKVVLQQITNSIKEYIEDINYLTDLHMPNLITYITNTYREQLVYIKFIGLNNYDSLYQSIYKNPIFSDNYFKETQTVPEFINVNTLDTDLPDITYTIVS